MPIKLVGRTTYFKGKTLWEILGNLKNFGVGRIVIRHAFQKYPEPCYMKVLKVAALPPPDRPYNERKAVVLVERVFRGLKNQLQLDTTTYKDDYMLIPKDQEHLYLKSTVSAPEKRILPRTMDFPPLFVELLACQLKKEGIVEAEEPKLNIKYNTNNLRWKNYRIAEPGESPTVKLNFSADPSKILNLETKT